MHIAIFSDSFLPAHANGGVPFSTYYLARELVRLGHQVRVVCTDRNSDTRLSVPLDRWTTFYEIPVTYCRVWPGPYVFAPKMVKFAKEAVQQADLVVSSCTLWTYAGFLADTYATRFSRPHVVYLRGLVGRWTMQQKIIRKKIFWHLQGARILHRASCIVALNASEAKAISVLGMKIPIEIIPNGIDRLDLEPVLSRSELDNLFPVLAGCPFLLFLGKMGAQKGLDILLPAFKQCRHSNKQMKLVLCGPIWPDYRYQFNDLLQSCKGENSVLHLGTVEGEVKNSLLFHSSALVLTSRNEGLPMAVLEAMAVGRPVVISEECNFPEVMQAQAGWVTRGDIQEVAHALREVLSNRTETERRGINARSLVERSYSWDNVGAQTDKLFQMLLGRRQQTDCQRLAANQ